MVKSIQRYRYKHACHITPSAAENKNSRQSFFSFFLIYPMIRGGVHVEGIRAREVLLLPQTLKNRRQLAHKLLRYTINEKFRNTPVLLLRDYRFFFMFFLFFSFLIHDRTNVRSFRSSQHARSKAPPTFASSINNIDNKIRDRRRLRSFEPSDSKDSIVRR